LNGATLPAPQPEQVELRTSQGLSTLFSAGYGRRTIMLWCLWFFALLGFYGLTTWLGALLQAKGFPVTKSVYYTILISLAGIPGFLTAAWMIEALGRKPTLIATLLGAAISSYFYGGATDQTQLIVAGLCMQFCAFGMWSALYAYTPELYPTHVRATGTGFASAVGRIGSLIGPSVIGFILPTAGQSGVFALGAGAFTLAALVVLVLGEETKGRTLESISH
jgi:putative MFS transporter